MKSTLSVRRYVANPRFAQPCPLHTVAAAFALSAVFPVLCFADTGDATAQPVVVTATRVAQSPRDVLSDNTVITADDIRLSGQTNLVELLQQQRGIEISASGGPGTVSSVFIRGASNAESIVLVDGVRIGSSTLGGATWENMPLSQIDRIEIVYGPLSSLYGADAMGGVVQIFTKQGDGAPHPSLAVGFGAYNTRNVDASIAGSSLGDNKVRYALDVARDESTGFSAAKPYAPFGVYDPDNDGYDKQSVSGQVSMDIAKGHVIGMGFLQSRNNAQVDEGLGANDRDIENLKSYRLYSRDQVMPGWTSLLQLSQSEDKLWSTNGPNWAIYGEMPNNTFDTLQTDLSWQNDLVFGSSLFQVVAERRTENVNTDAGVSGERATNSLAALYQWKSGNQLAVASVRDDDSSQYGSQTTGNLAYGYRITNAWRANGSVGTSFRAPTFNDLYFPEYGNVAIKPEQGKNAEIGMYYEEGKSRLSAVYYHNRITDMIIYDPVCPTTPALFPYGCAGNVGRATLTGLSLGGQTSVGKFTVHGSLDLQNPRDDILNTTIARRSKEHGSLGLSYQEGNIQIGVDSIFSGKRYDDEVNTPATELGGYGLLNLHASVDLSSDWTLFARWNNVLNKDYELAYGYTTPGSNLFVGVRYGYK